MTDTPYFTNLADAMFMLLTTYRRSGEPMPTPVWFAAVGNTLYLTTQGTSGKVKRMRATPTVTVAPCDQRGTLSGPALPARVRILAADEFGPADAALRTKYGEQYATIMSQMQTPSNLIFIEIVPNPGENPPV